MGCVRSLPDDPPHQKNNKKERPVWNVDVEHRENLPQSPKLDFNFVEEKPALTQTNITLSPKAKIRVDEYILIPSPSRKAENNTVTSRPKAKIPSLTPEDIKMPNPSHYRAVISIDFGTSGC